jgi:hypothetical protein
VDLGAHQLVGPLQQLCGHDDDRGGAVAHLLVLQLRKLHQDLQGEEKEGEEARGEGVL